MRFTLVLPLVTFFLLGGCKTTEDSSRVNNSSASNSLRKAFQSHEQRMSSIRSNPVYKSEFGSEPYLKLHEEGTAVKGSVVVFHGFSAKPVQQNRFVDYLFNQGYHVYNASVAGHYLKNLTTEAEVDVFQVTEQLQKAGVALKQNQTVSWPYRAEGRDPVAAYKKEIDETWKVARFLPKPLYVAGLSVGATQAIAMAAQYPEIRKIVAYAPLLKIEPKQRTRLKTANAGIKVARVAKANLKPIDGWFAWDPANQFPVGAFWGAEDFGEDVVDNAPGAIVANDQKVFLVTTHHEDAADTKVSESFFGKVGGAGRKGNFHFHYDEAMRVPHPVNAVDQRSQAMVNHYYRTLFQETVRFLENGYIKARRLKLQDYNSNIPGYQETIEVLNGPQLPPKIDLPQ